MFIIVGLGNYGSKYEHTRHNVGFDVLDIIAQKQNIEIKKNKCKCLLGEGIINGQKVVLAKPQTYMNLSGQAIVELMQWYKVSSSEILIIYDDIDIPFASVRYRINGSAGTHNGMRNILELAPDDHFPRLRVGVGRPPQHFDLANWVLSGYQSKEERAKIFEAYMLAADTAIAHVGATADEVRIYLSKQLANKPSKDANHAS
ncbi:MAG: aminoacyl-tRNA hydrolase [Eubacteriales bacterium]|nr:aminoacyl-tRNA hydrolase [Eubacteriales bacterium]